MKKIKLNKLNNGFSLLEILISIAVSAVVFPAVITLLGLSTFTASQGEVYTKAFTIAQEEMEGVYAQKSSDWSTLVDGTACSTKEVFTKCTTINTVSMDEKKVEVKVTWDERGTTEDLTIESLIADI